MGIRRGKGVSTAVVSISHEDMNRALHTREAVSLRVTIRIGHTGRYFEIRRAVVPLYGY